MYKRYVGAYGYVGLAALRWYTSYKQASLVSVGAAATGLALYATTGVRYLPFAFLAEFGVAGYLVNS